LRWAYSASTDAAGRGDHQYQLVFAVPNHYAGDASGATAARGAAMVQYAASRLVIALRAIKADQVSPRLQKEFFDRAAHPLDTPQ
jgi:creatinine amidohydrolase